jgi:peptide/nickel transport system permease protein
MARYVARRLLWTVVVLWAVITVTFGATFLSPIDPAAVYAGQRATPAQIAQVRSEFGLDDPLPVRYARYVERLLRGDLGRSYVSRDHVRGQILGRLPKTAELAVVAMMIQLAIGLPLGLAAALRRRSYVDRGILFLTLLGVAAPSFVTGFVLLYVVGFRLGWLPLGGSASWSAVILPALTLGAAGGAWYARMLRSATLNILGEDYIRTARSKGLTERIVVARHVLRNAIGPIIVMVGLDLGVFLGGVLIIEKVFAWPGIGLYAWQALEQNDTPAVLGTVIAAAICITLLNLLADIANAVIDPRVRYG